MDEFQDIDVHVMDGVSCLGPTLVEGGAIAQFYIFEMFLESQVYKKNYDVFWMYHNIKCSWLVSK